MRTRLFIIFTISALLAGAQQVSLRLLLQDEKNGGLVAGASLQVSGSIAAIESDSSGQAFAFAPQGKTIRLIVEHPAYYTISLKFMAYTDTVIFLYLRSLSHTLDEVTVKATKDNAFGISRLNNVEGTTIYAGKKSEAVYVGDLNANLAANSSRQIFSKIPGINVFENDGSGTTIGVGGRGLNPNRISNFNTRQNGYDISADALGYPESYYTPPTEAIERIEILRGAAGLQFGTQFGGMINYRFSEAPHDKRMTGNFRQTVGSYGFFNSFNQLQGTVGKYSYNTFYNYKHYDGWRDRSVLNNHNAFGSVTYRVSDRLSLKGEYTFMNLLSQQAGGLTDKQFYADPSLVTRQRNWFRVNWNLVSASADFKATDRTRFSLVTFGLDAGREALGFLGRADRPDDTTKNRNLLSDRYMNYGGELKMIHRYSLLGQNSHFLVGARYYRGHTSRMQGDADAGSAPRFRFNNPLDPENSAYEFPSRNCAVFVENIFQLTRRLSLTPGLRFENIYTASEGYYRVINRNLAGGVLLDQRETDNRSSARSFILGGLGLEYKVNKATQIYANFSQNYRSINFNDMRVLNPNFQVDPDLRDEAGFTLDGGYRGAIKNILYFDAGFFFLNYNDRIGTSLRVDSATYQIYRYRTNIGSSRNTGAEIFAELDWLRLFMPSTKHRLSTFVNFSYINAVYTSGLPGYKGNTVEYVPEYIIRTGVTYVFKKLSLTAQYSYTAEQFSDASNAISSPSGIYGLFPAYSILDISGNYTWKCLSLIAGVNNLLNEKYFTRRAEGYPGPGILPADPVNVYLTLRLKI